MNSKVFIMRCVWYNWNTDWTDGRAYIALNRCKEEARRLLEMNYAAMKENWRHRDQLETTNMEILEEGNEDYLTMTLVARCPGVSDTLYIGRAEIMAIPWDEEAINAKKEPNDAP